MFGANIPIKIQDNNLWFISASNFDYGVYCPIENGGNESGFWRTLTIDEWLYLLNKRTNASSLRTIGFVIDEKKYPHFYDLAEDKINNPYAIDKLKSTIHWIYDNIGLDAFKNIKSVDSDIVKYKNSYQPTLIETLLISVYIISTEMNFKSGINFRLKLNELLQKDSFQDLLGKDTMNSERISTRIDEVIKIFGE